jgi:hypothetical protein
LSEKAFFQTPLVCKQYTEVATSAEFTDFLLNCGSSPFIFIDNLSETKEYRYSTLRRHQKPQGAGKSGLNRCNEGTRPHQIAPGVHICKPFKSITPITLVTTQVFLINIYKSRTPHTL